MAVEGAVGQRDRLDLVEPARRLQVEQRLLDVAQRHGAVHRVRDHREGFDVVGLRPGEHHPVVVRLVAVAIGDDDVAGFEQRLVDHLVGGRGAVGDEEHAVGAEGARGRVLRLLDVARRLEQAVQSTGRRRRFREEQVGAVELAHVADPVRLEDRLAARDGQRVERADRTLRILLQVVEERGLVAVLDAVEDREVDLHRLLDLVEDAAKAGRRRVREDRVGLPVGEQDDVQVGAEALHQLGQREAVGAGRAIRQLGGQARGEQVLEQRHVARGFVGEAVVDHHRLEVGVEDHGERRVLERADEHRLVDELVLGTPQLPDLLGVRRPARRRRRRHEQHLEVGPRAPLRARGRHGAFRAGVVLRLELAGVAAIAPRHQRRRDALHQPRRAQRVAAVDPLLDRVQHAGARVGLEILQRQKRGERLAARGLQGGVAAAGRTRGPGLRRPGEVPPQVEARGDRGEEVIESGCVGLGHRNAPGAYEGKLKRTAN